MKIDIDEFNSEFCNVKFLKNERVVLLTWKKFCYHDDYRNPTLFALELLRRYPDTNLIIDARNGFEDKKEDVEWGFSVLLPAMSETDCKSVVFIMNEVNENNLEEEMDMWTKEFMKYFIVKKVTCYEDALILNSSERSHA